MKLKQVYEIEGFPHLDIQYHKELPEGVMGYCLAAQDIIQISIKENPTQRIMDQTLKHELLHYVIYKSGWNEILQGTKKKEEALVIMLENSIMPLITLDYKKPKV